MRTYSLVKEWSSKECGRLRLLVVGQEHATLKDEDGTPTQLPVNYRLEQHSVDGLGCDCWVRIDDIDEDCGKLDVSRFYIYLIGLAHNAHM